MLSGKQLGSLSTANSSARVQFEVIENAGVEASPPSLEDGSLLQAGFAPSRDRTLWQDRAGCSWHKPSVFYFRRELRNATGVHRARVVAGCLVEELTQLSSWAEEYGVSPFVARAVGLEFFRTALQLCSSARQVIAIG